MKGLVVALVSRAGTWQGKSSGRKEGDRLEGWGGVGGGPPLGSDLRAGARHPLTWSGGQQRCAPC